MVSLVAGCPSNPWNRVLYLFVEAVVFYLFIEAVVIYLFAEAVCGAGA